MSVFVKNGNQWVACNEIDEGGSINDNLQALGYDHNQFYTYTNFDMPYDFDNNSDSILVVCLKALSEEIICVITNPNRKFLSDTEVRQYMQNFVFSQDYSLYSLEGNLDDAIVERNFSIQFVAEALGIPYNENDTILYSSRFKYNFIFENGYLVDYEIADGYNRDAHDLKNSASWLFKLIESHAQKFHGTNDNAIKEINIQAQAFCNLPSGVKNEFLPEFENSDNSYNFKMLLVAKYQATEYEQGLNYEDCKCICHNELQFVCNEDEGLDKLVKYRYRNYILSFDDRGVLKSCVYNKVSSSSYNKSANNASIQSPNTGCMLTLIPLLCVMMSIVTCVIILL